MSWQDRASVDRIGRQLAGKGVSWQDMASVGRIWCQLAGYGVSWQDMASVGRIGYQLGSDHMLELLLVESARVVRVVLPDQVCHSLYWG